MKARKEPKKMEFSYLEMAEYLQPLSNQLIEQKREMFSIKKKQNV